MAKVPTRRLAECPKFKEMSAEEHGKFVEQVKACYTCLAWKHKGDKCKWKSRNKCTEKVNGNPCDGTHNTLLHGSGVVY